MNSTPLSQKVLLTLVATYSGEILSCRELAERSGCHRVGSVMVKSYSSLYPMLSSDAIGWVDRSV
ncbi:MAG: hypothetical protein U0518_03205 [Candidatus Gracilibacteria bacterium]